MITTEQNAGRPPQGLTSSDAFVSGHRLAQVVAALFTAYILVVVAAIASNVMQVRLLEGALTGDVTTEQARWNDIRQAAIQMLMLGVFIALVVAFLLWLYRVMRNLPALGNAKARVEHTPGWAVGSFFVPFMNLFIPYRAVREAWVKSDPAVHTEEDLVFTPPSPTGLVLAWWLSWVAMNFVARIPAAFASSPKDVNDLITASWLEVGADLARILSAGLAIQVVRGLDKRQEQRSRNVTRVAHTPPPPPIFTPPQA
jgi:Domain of unknown function (DUF4328)